MKKIVSCALAIGVLAATLVMVDGAAAQTAAAAEPTADEKVAGLEQMCAQAAEAIAARQKESSLYDRVGGREAIHAVVAGTVERHLVNAAIKHTLEGVDTDNLIKHVTDFLVVATGGQGKYGGRDMHSAHAHLSLTNTDFLAAGGDLGAAMATAGWGESEAQEMLCAFVSLRGEVVTQ
jgi:hemoglobin